MLYEFLCPENHIMERNLVMGGAPRFVLCDLCGNEAPRLFGSPILINEDEYRKAYLSHKSNDRLWRDEMAPKDKSEVKAIQEATGRVYVNSNSDYSKMNIPKNTTMEENMKKHGNPWGDNW